MPILHPNHRFLLQAAHRAKGPVLDYGCGDGALVLAGREEGIDIVGAEVFYAGADSREQVEAAGLLGSAVYEIVDGRLPFANGSFELVVNNQVFEHVEDLDAALDEVARVMRPGGSVVSLFPSADVWREGHCGIPFLHWFSPTSRWRYRYALTLRRMGLGSYKGAKSAEMWTADFLDWLDRFCFYRSRRQIDRAFRRRFDISYVEPEFLAFRVAQRWPRLRGVVRKFPFGRTVVRKLAGLVILARKPA